MLLFFFFNKILLLLFGCNLWLLNIFLYSFALWTLIEVSFSCTFGFIRMHFFVVHIEKEHWQEGERMIISLSQ